MYSRGYPSPNPRFSPHRRGGGGGGNYQSPEFNMMCPPPQRTPNQGRYRTPSPGGYRGARQQNSPSPGFQAPRSPMHSPFLAPGPRSPYQNVNGYPGCPFPGPHRSPRPNSPRHNLYPYSPSPRSRGPYGPGANTSTPYQRGRGRKNFGERNPGGSENIKRYYNPSMVEDPWRTLTPLPATSAPVATT